MTILSMYPLPLITYAHDSSAALLNSTEVLYAFEEEKLSRTQYAISQVAEKAAVIGMKQAEVHPRDITSLVITSMENCGAQPDFIRRVQYMKDLLTLDEGVEVTCVPHHLAHSALAVLSSPFAECAFLTMDGGGDGLMGHWGIFRNGEFQIVEEFTFSPAIVFGFMTTLAGFSLFEEGKLMGLAGFGQVCPRMLSWLREHFRIPEGSASLDISPQLSLMWHTSLYPDLAEADSPRRHKYYRLGVGFTGATVENWTERVSPADIAATAQVFFEELVLRAVDNIREATGIARFALGGGAFQNVVVNGRLRWQLGVEPFVSMAPHDAGLSLGAGLLTQHLAHGRRSRRELSAYLGPDFHRDDVESIITSFGLRPECPEDIAAAAAQALADGHIVGWFHGRAEFGARALGARSVLADPRCRSSRSRVNQVLKKRDWFMPYAPVVLEEHGCAYFEGFAPSPYMNTVFRIRPEKADLVPAAVHVDGTCRVQSVNAEQNPTLYRVISHFERITGVPMILNTSFNRHGVPIVATPRQAIQHLLEGNVDLLAIEGFMVAPVLVARERSVPPDDSAECEWSQLEWAAALLRRGRVEDAYLYLARTDLPLSVRSDGFAIDGTMIWTTNGTVEELRAWFARYVTERRSSSQ